MTTESRFSPATAVAVVVANEIGTSPEALYRELAKRRREPPQE